MSRPRVGFLGAGWIGRHRMHAISRENVVDIVAIAEPDPSCAKAAASEVATAQIVTGTDDLLSLDLDGVVIATPSALHASQSLTFLQRDVAVFCQKPVGRDAAEVRAVVDAAEKADRLLAVDLSYRFADSVQRALDVIHSGEIGAPFSIDLTFHNAYGPDKPWFYDRTQSGGGCLIDLGIHLVDLAFWLTDATTATDVGGHLYRHGTPFVPTNSEVEDFAIVDFTLDEQIRARVTTSWNVSAGCDAVIGAEIFGSDGSVVWRNVNGSFYDFETIVHRGRDSRVVATPPDEWGGRAAVDWARRLAEGARFDPDVRGLVTSAAVLDQAYGISGSDERLERATA